MTLRPRHVLIIGGGLAGPCLALSLARHSIRSTIFEIRPTRSDSGGSISLGPSALQVLDRHAGVYDQIRAAGFIYTRMGAYADNGEKFGDVVVGDEEGGYPAVRIMRSTLHKILLDAGEKAGGLINVKWGAKMTKIEESVQGVTAHFEDESMKTEGDIVIGADGIHSKVREHVLGSQAPASIFTNTCIVNGFLPASSAITPSPDFTFPAFMFTPSGLFMTIPIDPEGKTLAWSITKPEKERSREEWRDFELSGEAARLAKADFSDILAEPVRSLLDNADEKKARAWAPYYIPDLPTWHKGRVCLVGDAAHGMPPNGQGSAMAFEDVAIMTRLLIAEGVASYDQLFSRFEAIRRARIDHIKETSKPAEAFKGKTAPWVWYMKKWAFRAFFWWKAGILYHHGGEVYNVDEVSIDG